MRVKFDFGKTKSGSLGVVARVLSDIVSNACKKHNLTFGGCNIYINFYDKNGRLQEIGAKKTDPDTGELLCQPFSYVIRNQKYRIDNPDREYIGVIYHDQNAPESDLHLYRVFGEDEFVIARRG